MVMENMDDNKEKLTAKFAKMGQNFFNNKVSNNTDENLNWRKVKQKVPT